MKPEPSFDIQDAQPDLSDAPAQPAEARTWDPIELQGENLRFLPSLVRPRAIGWRGRPRRH